jgi:dihydroflavonol-4-reductase
VGLTTITFFDYHDTPLTEHSPLDPHPTRDPYTITKRAAYLDAMARAEAGQDICLIVPGAAFGCSPLPARTMVAPSWNQRFADAIEGRLSEYLSFKIPFVDAADVASATLAALDHGRRGERYLAFGGQDDILTLPEFCNLACELAGSPHRVAAVPIERLDDPEILARYGPSIVALAKKPQPEPLFRYGQTIERLGYKPTPMRDALAQTIPWLRKHKLMAG